jgi:hypothetical protein
MEQDHDASVLYSLSTDPASAWWRRLDANPAADQAYQRTSKGLFQP